VGRAQYATGKLNEARQSLERALAKDQDDNTGAPVPWSHARAQRRLPPGRERNRKRHDGLHDWLEYIERTRPFEAYWESDARDPRRDRKRPDKISSKDIDPQQLIADAEWVGQRMESEIDRARRDERRRYENEFDRRRGPSVGVGVGF